MAFCVPSLPITGEQIYRVYPANAAREVEAFRSVYVRCHGGT